MFKSQKALVIGGTTGIGKMFANVFESSGCDVVAVGRQQWNVITDPCPYDLSKFDTVVFSAGIEAGGNQNFLDQNFDDVELTLQTNLISQMRWFHAYCQTRTTPSRVFFIGSAFSCREVAMHKLVYGVSRIAIREFVSAVRKELAEKHKPIHVVFVRPGGVATNFYRNKHQHKRPVSDKEVAEYYSQLSHITVDQLRQQLEPFILGQFEHIEEIVVTLSPI
jgi:short-subunit dehydrogenase